MFWKLAVELGGAYFHTHFRKIKTWCARWAPSGLVRVMNGSKPCVPTLRFRFRDINSQTDFFKTAAYPDPASGVSQLRPKPRLKRSSKIIQNSHQTKDQISTK